MNGVWIYALCNDEKLPRYVGKSVDPLKRFKSHLKDKSNVKKAHWIQSLVAQNKLPVLILLEFASNDDWKKCERRWILRFRKRGIDLHNHTDGGEGLCNPTYDTRKKLSDYRKSLWNDPKTREKQLEISRSDSRCLAISKALKGKSHHWQKKLPQNNKGFKKTGAALIKASETVKIMNAAGIEWHRGKPMHPNAKAGLLMANIGNKYTLGRKIPQEENERRSKKIKGIKRSDSTKKKMSNAAKIRWERQRYEKQQLTIGVTNDKLCAAHQ